MPESNMPLAVFTKPWGHKSLPELAEFVAKMGFAGVELPVRPKFQVEPDTIEKGLPQASKILKTFGLRIFDIAGTINFAGAPPDERAIAACAEAEVPMLRVLIQIDRAKGYMATIDAARKQFDRLMPLLEKHNVAIGIQNHADYFIGSVIGIIHAVEPFDPRRVQVVLDPAHCALAGEPEEMAVDIAMPRLGLVNLKNAIRRKKPANPDTKEVAWETWWTAGWEGFASWKKTIDNLRRRGYTGPLCLPAEYSDEHAVDRMILEDLAYVKQLLAQP